MDPPSELFRESVDDAISSKLEPNILKEDIAGKEVIMV